MQTARQVSESLRGRSSFTLRQDEIDEGRLARLGEVADALLEHVPPGYVDPIRACIRRTAAERRSFDEADLPRFIAGKVEEYEAARLCLPGHAAAAEIAPALPADGEDRVELASALANLERYADGLRG